MLNALFGTNLVTSHIGPGTKDGQKVIVKAQDGGEIWFWDLPGFGQSEQLDEVVWLDYQRKLIESDAVIWAIQTCSGSLLPDKQWLDRLLQAVNAQHREALLNKITFVLTKSDLVIKQPWMLVRLERCGYFVPQMETKAILEEKGHQCLQTILGVYSEMWSTAIEYNRELSKNLDVLGLRFELDEHLLHCYGPIDNEMRRRLEMLAPNIRSSFASSLLTSKSSRVHLDSALIGSAAGICVAPDPSKRESTHTKFGLSA